MKEKQEACYAAFKSKDPRFDGHFFVGVASTGIYCRPVCRAKLPKPENCSYYTTAAEAEQAGFRPCLQCRPELAPGFAPVDATASLAHRVARHLEENCGDVENLEALAAHLGFSDRHLRRAFVSEYRVTPVQYLQTCRLLLAKNLLTDTKLSVLETAMASGFGSLRRFNDLFKKQYRLAPTALRRQAANGGGQDGQDIAVTLGYRPPYQWDRLLDFLKMRAIPGVEVVRGGAYYRTVRLTARDQKSVYGWIRVEHYPLKSTLRVTASSSLLSVLPQVLSRVRHLFDLYCDPNAVSEGLSTMNGVQGGLFVPGTRLPGCFDSFELTVRAVLGQQITVKAARTIAGRMAEAYGTLVQTDLDGLTHAFPAAKDILALGEPIAEYLGPLGITSARAKTILALAQAFEEETIDFSVGANPDRELRKLMNISGIGAWTAQYIAMRALGWTDAFPDTDHGIRKVLSPRSGQEILALADHWRPWRGYATIHLWNALYEEGNNMWFKTNYASPVGHLTLASDGESLNGLWMQGQKYFGMADKVEMTEKDDLPVFEAAKGWLDRYFSGKRPAISELPLAPVGSDFRQEVWKLLCEIPYGATTTYGEIAKKLSKSGMSAQAVGGAVGHNPISIIIPCHRVVGSSGSLTGYAGGIEKKIWLLKHEGVDMTRLTSPSKGTAL